MGLGTVERFLSCVTEHVEPELVLWAEEGTAHQTLVPTASPFPLPLFLVLCLSFCPPCSGTSKHFGGASSFLVLQRQCGNMVWGIGGSCCHGSPRVPLPLKLGRGCLAFQALVRYRGEGMQAPKLSAICTTCDQQKHKCIHKQDKADSLFCLSRSLFFFLHLGRQLNSAYPYFMCWKSKLSAFSFTFTLSSSPTCHDWCRVGNNTAHHYLHPFIKTE